jgi:uncharacterized protein (DUF58 family)
MIPPHVLRELRYIELATAKKIRAARVGPHTSQARGPGFDFDQHLPYRAGDDVRRIDWNVTARLTTPYLCQTHAERELNVVLAVDLSRSMDIGSTRNSKRDAMTFVTASVLFSAAGDHINTGFLAFSDRVLTWSPPRRTTGRAWRILEELWALAPERSRTSVLPALSHLVSTLKTASLVFLISDFVTDEDLFGSTELRSLVARHDVVAVVVEDPAETALPPGRGFIRVRDVETGHRIVVSLNGRSRWQYAEAVARRRRALVNASYSLGMECVVVRTDQPATEPLLELFARRRQA